MKKLETIEDWAEATVELYNKLGLEEGYDFGYYTQSCLENLNKVKCLLIAINPGSVGPFSPKTAKEFLKGNGFGDNWNPKGVLATILNYAGENEALLPGNYISTNFVHFNSKFEKGKSGLPKDLFAKCGPLTLELVNIVKPTLTIIMGKTPRSLFCSITKKEIEPLIEGELWRAFLNDNLVVFIPHSNKRKPYRYNDSEKQMLGKAFELLIKNPHIEPSELRNCLKESGFEISGRIDADAVEEFFKKEYASTSYDGCRYRLNDFFGITVTHEENGYIGVRHILPNKGKQFDYTHELDEQTIKLCEILRQRGYKPKSVPWIGTKKFSRFNCRTTKEVIESIKEEIKVLKNLLSK